MLVQPEAERAPGVSEYSALASLSSKMKAQGFYLEAICDLGIESSLLGKTSKIESGFGKIVP